MMHHDSRPPLRLLLVTDGSTIPTWLFKCVDSVERSGAATCVTVLRATPEDARSTFRFGHGLRRFLFRLYQNVDRRLFRGFPDAHAPSDRRSVSRSQNHVYWKMSAAVARNVQMLWEDPHAFLERLEAAASFDVTRNPSRAPGNLEMLRAGTVLLGRYVSDKCVDTLYREQWALAYRHGTGDRLRMEGFRQLIPPLDRFWADPFPVQVGNDHYIFHEELLFSTGKGSIVLTVVDDKGPVAPPIPVLETDYHLSYPFVFQWDGDFFMMPETASRRQVELYRCVDFPTRWKLERVVLRDLKALDPTPALLFGRWWLFANTPAYG